MEVDGWTGFTQHFKHLKSGAVAEDQHLLLTAILADAINLGLSKMAESCPGVTYAKLTWLQAWHIRDETDSAGLAELVNAQYRQPIAAYWGDGTTSSSDGQNFKAGGLNLVVAAIILWNTVYLERAVQALRDSGKDIDEKLLPHLSPLGWEHITLTGDYIWRQDKQVEQGKFRPLRILGEA